MKNNCFVIKGGYKLYGEIKNQTSKNATLPIMSACLLASGKSVIKEYPKITDVDNMVSILKKLGAKVRKVENNLHIETNKISSSCVDCNLSKKMRSSIFLLGALLARCKTACVTLPGGCQIGKRPIDIHINTFKKLGVTVEYFSDNIIFNAKEAKPCRIKLKLPSVGATENLVQFCCLLKGKTTILNAAKEPEVVDLCNFLNKMGAKIIGAGTNKITIYGVDKLHAVEYRPIGDRIVAGTLAVAVASVGGEVTIRNACPYQNIKLIEKLCSMGCQIDIKNDIMHIVNKTKLISPNSITTGYYPDFATDLQSILLSACTIANGTTSIKENVFENRFLITEELNKMGANINIINPQTAEVRGVDKLCGKQVIAKDLRGGAALVIAGLIARGETIVKNIHFIDRGYENLEVVLSKLGANIVRV